MVKTQLVTVVTSNISDILPPTELPDNLKGLCQLESMRSEVIQITFKCQNSIVFNA